MRHSLNISACLKSCFVELIDLMIHIIYINYNYTNIFRWHPYQYQRLPVPLLLPSTPRAPSQLPALPTSLAMLLSLPSTTPETQPTTLVTPSMLLIAPPYSVTPPPATLYTMPPRPLASLPSLLLPSMSPTTASMLL